jgi:hypothetical protein
MSGDVTGHCTASGGMSDMNSVTQVQMRGELSDIRRVRVHVVGGSGLRGAPMAATVMRDHTLSVCHRKNIICASQSSADKGQL